MSELKTGEAKARVTEAIKALEKKTSAEVVVAMRPTSGDYRAADYVAGAITALVVVCVFLYSPDPFDFTFFPLEQLGAFALGATACAHVPALRRALTPKWVRRENVERAARAAFVELGVSRKHARTGVLVYLSGFEVDIALVTDLGIDPKTHGLAEARTALRAAKRSGDLDDFVGALGQLGEALAKAYPHHEDDVDELSDEVAA